MKRIVFLLIFVACLMMLTLGADRRRFMFLIEEQEVTYVAGDDLLLENGDYILLEGGSDHILLE